MVSKKNNSNKSSAAPVVEVAPAAPAPVVEVAPVAPAPVVEAAPATPAKGGKKGKKTETAAPVVEAAPAPVPAPVVEAAPVAAEPKKGGKKKAAAPVEVVATPEPVVAAPVQEAGAAAPKRKGKKAAAAQEAAPVAPATTEAEAEPEDDGKTRSFKVKLPNSEEYTGRFTGLTPYQAANKALSKYFRNSENTNLTADHVIFSIKESTRGSDRNVYTYRGNRIKLETPITYTIKSKVKDAEGVEHEQERTIVKQYKNQLIKIKKAAVNAETATPVATA